MPFFRGFYGAQAVGASASHEISHLRRRYSALSDARMRGQLAWGLVRFCTSPSQPVLHVSSIVYGVGGARGALEVAEIDLLTAKNSRSLSSALSPLLKQRAPAKRLMDAAIQWALFSCAENTTRGILCHFGSVPLYFFELHNYFQTEGYFKIIRE